MARIWSFDLQRNQIWGQLYSGSGNINGSKLGAGNLGAGNLSASDVGTINSDSSKNLWSKTRNRWNFERLTWKTWRPDCSFWKTLKMSTEWASCNRSCWWRGLTSKPWQLKRIEFDHCLQRPAPERYLAIRPMHSDQNHHIDDKFTKYHNLDSHSPSAPTDSAALT